MASPSPDRSGSQPAAGAPNELNVHHRDLAARWAIGSPWMIVMVAGVSGSGKSTVGALLAEQLGWRFEDGDDLHPASNIAKMEIGVPLKIGRASCREGG